MSDPIKHECGLALVRLRKPLAHYREKYGTALWGLDKLQLLMIKQRNRGQDGAGVATVKFGMPMGEPYIHRARSAEPDAVSDVFENLHRDLRKVFKKKNKALSDTELKQQFDFIGEVYLGHLRYGTFSADGVSTCHPYVRPSMTATRNLVLAGNFNLTNAKEIFDKLVSYGLKPIGVSDTLTVLEKIGHFLDQANDELIAAVRHEKEDVSGEALALEVSQRLDIASVLTNASKDWDGGYAFAGLIGNGDAFICRDPNGIRPIYYYVNDEVVAAASERAALTTIFNVELEEVRYIGAGHVLSIRRNGEIEEFQFKEPGEIKQCSFERIYFSRGNDAYIYQERKALGRNLAQRTIDAVNGDVDHTVFSFVPNTAETAFLGLIEGIGAIQHEKAAEHLWNLHEKGSLSREDLRKALNGGLRVEKAAHKDAKLRTFITQDKHRSGLVNHVYDITRKVVNPDDTLVVLDDSIVRGTTLRESIITMLSRLNPKRIVVLSSAPPIKYPDCYGIDMSEFGRFVAFEAAIALRKSRGESDLIKQVYQDCLAQADRPRTEIVNHIARIYDGISLEDLSAQIARLIRPTNIPWPGELQIVYQTIEGLHNAIPKHRGDWYFTGNYPTPGGYKVVNTAFINFFKKKTGRSY